MLKKLLPILIVCLIILVSANTTFAQTSSPILSTIGTSSVTSPSITQWSYTSANPTLSGTVQPSEVVTITIDSVSETVTADATGNWTYTPTTLTEGTHTLTVAAGAQTMSLSITIGSSTSATTTSTTTSTESAMPVTGAVENTILLIGGGLLVMGAGVYSYRQVVAN